MLVAIVVVFVIGGTVYLLAPASDNQVVPPPVITKPVDSRLSDQVVDPALCAQDAKQCPDGSFVSRRGPKCEFAACPAPVTKAVVPPVPVVTAAPGVASGKIYEWPSLKFMQELRELSAGFSADRLNGFRIKYPQGWSIQEANGKNFGSVGGPIATLIPPAVLGVGDEIHIGSIGQDKTCVSYSRCRYAPGYPWMWTSSKNPTVLAAFDQIATGATRSDGTSITYHDPSYVNELIPLSKSVGTPSIFTLFDVIYENRFATASDWRGSGVNMLVINQDPDDAANRVITMNAKDGPMSFYRDIDIPKEAVEMSFDYMFRKPLGSDDLTVYIYDPSQPEAERNADQKSIRYYDFGAGSLAQDHLNMASTFFQDNEVGKKMRINFVLRPGDGVPGAGVIIDNLRFYSAGW
jgi:hypothetical protein